MLAAPTLTNILAFTRKHGFAICFALILTVCSAIGEILALSLNRLSLDVLGVIADYARVSFLRVRHVKNRWEMSLRSVGGYELVLNEDTLFHLVHDELGHHFFSAHVRSEYSEENTLFLRDVAEYKRVFGERTEEQRWANAKSMYLMYADAGGERQVGIPETVRRRVADLLGTAWKTGTMPKLDGTEFDDMAYEIMRLLQTDSMKRFLRSQYCRSLITELVRYRYIDENVTFWIDKDDKDAAVEIEGFMCAIA